ncbi:MAG: pentapeptide repeat-containing protein [Pseudanabaenaceae cyanobacterium SKYGB_i_bin29]|nr:pentapeptide repeat-containing protein [Pseudanabaenaceae cyanobacterium SKYG29]MDW8420693.1 pentapeptide repeat-containing protein [Pseudanabaenaceae cyanobacterium SKYGB_i_bin29]
MRQDHYGLVGAGQNLSQRDWSYDVLIRADLRATNLRGGNFSYADLRAANLQGADLRGAILHYTCFLRADLRGADLQEAEIVECRWQGAIYDQATRFPAYFNYRSVGMIGPRANLNGAQLNTAYLRHLDLSEASLLGAYLGGADLTGANLRGARLSQADLRYAFLTGANLQGARLTGANLAGADLRATNWAEVDIDRLDSIAGADFSLAVGMSDRLRQFFLSLPGIDELHPLTRRSTRESLSV